MEQNNLRNIKMVLEYDGSKFHGFQKQKIARLATVQGLLEKTLSQITGESIKTVSAGRTDKGVHALHQVITFKTKCDKPAEELKRAVNALCCDKISVIQAQEMPPRFHARFTATSRTYRYYILNRMEKPTIGLEYIYHYKKKLDIERMRSGAVHFIGEKDFLGFSSCIKETEISIRKVFSLHINTGDEYLEKHGCFEIPVRGSWVKDIIVIELKASGFLRSMARMICAMLIRIGTGRSEPDEVLRILEKKNPSLLPAAAPAHALYLSNVTYD